MDINKDQPVDQATDKHVVHAAKKPAEGVEPAESVVAGRAAEKSVDPVTAGRAAELPADRATAEPNAEKPTGAASAGSSAEQPAPAVEPDAAQPAEPLPMKKKIALNIVSGKVEHRGFGAGAINLSQLSSVIIEGDEAYLDMGALHAKSKVEKGIKFSVNKEDVPNGESSWIVWVAADRKDEGMYYAGVTSCEMLVDREARRGWKILADHVNRMDYALKRRIMLDNVGDREKAALKKLLMEYNPEMWANSGDDLKAALG